MKPIYLKMWNLFSHEETVIDFSTFDTAVFLGRNGAGKSAVLGGIRWALFGKVRSRKIDDAVRRGQSEGGAEFIFESWGKKYKIVRKRNKQIKESDLLLFQDSGGEWENINSDTNTMTDENIVKIIGFNHDTFINSVYCGENDISVFYQSSVGKRKDIVKSLLKLDKWDRYQKATKKFVSEAAYEVQSLQDKMIPVEEIESRLSDLAQDIKNGQAEIIKLNEEKSSLVAKLEELQGLKTDTKSHIKKEIASIEKQITSKKSELKILMGKISSNAARIKQNKEKLKAYKEAYGKLAETAKQKPNFDLDSYKAKLLRDQARVDVIKGQLKKLKEGIKVDDECPECLRPIQSKDEADAIIQNRENRKIELINESKALEGGIIKLRKDIVEADGLLKKAGVAVDKRKGILLEAKNVKELTEILQSSSDEHNESAEKLKVEISSLESLLPPLQSQLGDDNEDYLAKEESRVKANVKIIEGKINQNHALVGGLKAKVEQEKQEIIRQEQIQALLLKKVDELEIYEKLRDGFGKNGIQSVIIENVIDELENYTNKVLAEIVSTPMMISIVTQKQDSSGKWAETFEIDIHYEGAVGYFEDLSLGERFRVSFALRLALSEIMSKRMGGDIRMLLLDEVTSALDDDGIEMFCQIMDKLSEDMKIIIITHDEKLKERFDDVFMFSKDDVVTKVQQLVN